MTAPSSFCVVQRFANNFNAERLALFTGVARQLDQQNVRWPFFDHDVEARSESGHKLRIGTRALHNSSKARAEANVVGPKLYWNIIPRLIAHEKASLKANAERT